MELFLYNLTPFLFFSATITDAAVHDWGGTIFWSLMSLACYYVPDFRSGKGRVYKFIRIVQILVSLFVLFWRLILRK